MLLINGDNLEGLKNKQLIYIFHILYSQLAE